MKNFDNQNSLIDKINYLFNMLTNSNFINWNFDKKEFLKFNKENITLINAIGIIKKLKENINSKSWYELWKIYLKIFNIFTEWNKRILTHEILLKDWFNF